jgi:nucleotide-binding universal stress UspA family protein
MDQISPDEGTPEQRRPERRQQDRVRPDPIQRAAQPRPISVAHPVVAGYNGSASARNALAYAAGMARRLGRPLLMVYVTSPGVYCEPLTGQVVGVVRDADSLERWLLTELDQAADASELEVHVRTRRGSPARELASIAAEFSADALVIGAPRHFWHHVIGSVPSWLARNARCPVIVVPLSSSSGQQGHRCKLRHRWQRRRRGRAAQAGLLALADAAGEQPFASGLQTSVPIP